MRFYKSRINAQRILERHDGIIKSPCCHLAISKIEMKARIIIDLQSRARSSQRPDQIARSDNRSHPKGCRCQHGASVCSNCREAILLRITARPKMSKGVWKQIMHSNRGLQEAIQSIACSTPMAHLHFRLWMHQECGPIAYWQHAAKLRSSRPGLLRRDRPAVQRQSGITTILTALIVTLA